MSQVKTLNGVQYTLPQYNDTAWGANTGNVLTQYIAAIADVTLQLSGGSFTLTADVDFGANFGLKALFLKSETANPASAGVVRLAKTDSVAWRNNANGADKLLNIDASDNLQYASTKVLLSGAVVNADINASAAIAYSKLALTGSIVNADINASAAIAYTKLALSASIVNADIATSAAIAYSKLALTASIVNGDLVAGTLTNAAINASAAIALTKLAAMAGHSKALASDASGFIVESSVTATELGYVSGVTSAIQTQINAIASHYFQTVQATTATATSVASSTFTVTLLTATITPASSAHKIKISVSGSLKQTTNAGFAFATIARGGVNLGGSRGMAELLPPSAAAIYAPCSMTYVDSPATTSPVTYAVYIATDGSGTVSFPSNTNVQCNIILEEIS